MLILRQRHHRALLVTARRFSATKNIDRRVRIGNVEVSSSPLGSGRADLIPKLLDQYQSLLVPPPYMSHLRWMLQKDLVLKQDFLLLGAPELARDRRALVHLYAALVGREVEYVSLSKDTSDADLKQRKEILNQKSIYVNQAPVRAALHGRLLILDGVERAERNVLPTLNNLLENRELNLDDGYMLVSPEVYDEHDGDSSDLQIHRVHSDFRVAALGSTLGESAMLDPPLRSRFQGRFTSNIEPGDVLSAMSNLVSKEKIDIDTLKEVVQLNSESPNGISLQSMKDSIQYLERYQESITPQAAINAHRQNMISAEDVMNPFKIQTQVVNKVRQPSTFIETSTTSKVKNLLMAAFENGKRAVACVGPKGSFKSAIARETARQYGKEVELFSLHPDITSRDLLQTRQTDAEGNTIWKTTPVTRALEQGTWVILDGIDKIGADTLTSLSLIMEGGEANLPDGRRIIPKEGFYCIALAQAHDEIQWIQPEIVNMFHWIKIQPLPSNELTEVLSGLYPNLDKKTLQLIVKLHCRLNEAIASGAADSVDEKESLMLTLRKMKHICQRLEKRGVDELANVVHACLLTNFMPKRGKTIVQSCMKECNIIAKDPTEQKGKLPTLDKQILDECSRTATNPLLVPNTIFKENPGHSQVMQDILEAHSAGERALLIMGYQGVGKNKVVDHLLSRLNCEREYLQLHRDTTIQSLTSTPSVENGQIKYKDSALVRAAKYGRILVLDEADKAKTEVVALLKGLIEDGELALPDGRILRYANDDTSSAHQDIVLIHPEFRVWALANPSGFPFHGNDLAREMADVFSCHTVSKIDRGSHRQILKSYGPSLSESFLEKILIIWDELTEAHERGEMGYPFSIRESVAVVKHLEGFPMDGIDAAIENVISFDRSDRALIKQLNNIFSRHGIKIVRQRNINKEELVGGLSTPKTRASFPKHGKIDPDNTPHVGGNTWHGGTGGSDTAGLGGRGGPYRVDSGHPVHQISEEMKAEVSEEAQQRARQMAKEELEKKLEELNMGKPEWEMYNDLREKVLVQIQQLKVNLKDIKRRKEERVWIKRQSTGELDDSRLVDALAGEKDVFKRRGSSIERNEFPHNSDPISIKLVVDVSASMYRFNSFDRRLELLLETTLMLMETLRDDKRFQLTIVGHNGSSGNIPFLDRSTKLDERTQLKILQSMVAHSQYTYPGDCTLEAINATVKGAKPNDLILVISDANLRRYRIEAKEVSKLVQRQGVHSHLILIGATKEAKDLAKEIPNERAQVCLDSADLPIIIKSIVKSAAK